MVKILIAGDYCPQSRVEKLILEKRYSEVFGDIVPLIEKVDYAIVNLECPVVFDNAKPIEKNGPNLRTTPKALSALKYAGFDMVTLANNHFYDFGEQGVLDTLETCK